MIRMLGVDPALHYMCVNHTVHSFNFALRDKVISLTIPLDKLYVLLEAPQVYTLADSP